MVGKKGVVKDPVLHRDTIVKVIDFSFELGFSVLGLTYSPVKGPEGNIEYLVFLKKQQCPKKEINAEQIRLVVEASHQSLDKPQ